MIERTYPAKVILFGEYSLLLGSQVLGLPLHARNGYWTDTKEPNSIFKKGFLHYLATECSDVLAPAKVNEIKRGELFYGSTIKRGYGTGSSGALSAAIFDFCKRAEISDQGALQKTLAKIESFFHGTSSGFDPLLSYLDQPILKDKAGQYRIPEWPTDYDELDRFSLMDSGTKRMVKGLVTRFVEWTEERPDVYQELARINDRLIDAFLAGESLMDHMRELSTFQWEHMRPMILESVQEVWANGLASGDYCLKLCGTGGGGYYMIYGDVPSDVSERFDVERLEI